MNKNLLFSIIIILGISSCSESGENEVKNVTNQDSVETVSGEGQEHVSHTESFQHFIKTDDGLLRGVKMNMSMEEVKKLEEESALDEETPTQLDFMVDYAGLENAEINYLFDDSKKLKGIELHVYPKNIASQDSIFAEFGKYFTEKVGKPLSSDSTTIKWENKLEDLNVILAKKGNMKVHDVNISISKIGLKPKA